MLNRETEQILKEVVSSPEEKGAWYALIDNFSEREEHYLTSMANCLLEVVRGRCDYSGVLVSEGGVMISYMPHFSEEIRAVVDPDFRIHWGEATGYAILEYSDENYAFRVYGHNAYYDGGNDFQFSLPDVRYVSELAYRKEVLEAIVENLPPKSLDQYIGKLDDLNYYDGVHVRTMFLACCMIAFR